MLSPPKPYFGGFSLKLDSPPCIPAFHKNKNPASTWRRGWIIILLAFNTCTTGPIDWNDCTVDELGFMAEPACCTCHENHFSIKFTHWKDPLISLVYTGASSPIPLF